MKNEYNSNGGYCKECKPEVDTIMYKGKSYPTRTIDLYLDNEPDTDYSSLTLAPDSLMVAMQANAGDTLEDGNGEEETIDNQIYFYVEEGRWNDTDEQLAKDGLDDGPYRVHNDEITQQENEYFQQVLEEEEARETKEFLLKDKTGRGFTGKCFFSILVSSWDDEQNYDGITLPEWAEEATEGDTFENSTLTITCIAD